jgi:hypothetical protein
MHHCHPILRSKGKAVSISMAVHIKLKFEEQFCKLATNLLLSAVELQI